MTLDEIKSKLESAMKVRIPQFPPDLPAREKIAKLEDHILLVAYHRGELEEALHWCIEAGKKIRVEWDAIQGYEVGLPSRPTKEQVEASKGQIRPDLYTSLQDARSLTTSLRRQIERLGGSDYDAASRAYTMLSGS